MDVAVRCCGVLDFLGIDSSYIGQARRSVIRQLIHIALRHPSVVLSSSDSDALFDSQTKAAIRTGQSSS